MSTINQQSESFHRQPSWPGTRISYLNFCLQSEVNTHVFKKRYKYDILVEKLSVVVHEFRLVGNFAQYSGF